MIQTTMKKLHRKGTVHPSPPLISDHLAFLPATILTLAAALSPEDREVLAYLIYCSSINISGNRQNTQKTAAACGVGKGGEHPPAFNCNCFGCYLSYWVRWDSSPNRQLIHEIIDAFEDGLAQSEKEKSKKRRRQRGSKGSDELKRASESVVSSSKDDFGESESAEEATAAAAAGGGFDSGGCRGACGSCSDEGEEGFENGSVKKFVNFIGERLWSVWIQGN